MRTTLPYLPADLAQVKQAREYKRFNFFGFRFGPSRVKNLRLIADDYGLNAQVLIGKKWRDVSDSLVMDIATRHAALAAHFDQLTRAPFAPTPAAPKAARPVLSIVTAAATPVSALAQGQGNNAAAKLQAMQRLDQEEQAARAAWPELFEQPTPRTHAELDKLLRPSRTLPEMVEVRRDKGVLVTPQPASASRTLAWVQSQAQLQQEAAVGQPAPKLVRQRAASDPTAAMVARQQAVETEKEAELRQQKLQLRLRAQDPATRAAAAAYCEQMLLPTTYGGSLEMYAIEQMFGLNFIVIQQTPVLDAFGQQVGHKLEQVAGDLRKVDPYYPPFVLLRSGVGADWNDAGAHYQPVIYNVGEEVHLDADFLKRAKDVPGDGSCLFHSFVALFAEGSRTAQQMREMVVEWLEDNAFKLSAARLYAEGAKVPDTLLGEEMALLMAD